MRFGCYGYEKYIVECRMCGLKQLWPQWTEEELEILYQKYSQKEDFKGQKKEKVIHKNFVNFFKDDKILEVGCGSGETVEYYRNQGYKITGIDRDTTIKKDYIHNIDIFDYDTTIKFDVIYSLHFLEHANRSKELLEKLSSLLAVNGAMYFEVPNVDDPLLSVYKNKAYDKFYWYPYHSFFFNKKTIQTLFDSVGLKSRVYLRQRYGIVNHLRWLLFGKPGNCNPTIPILDRWYKRFMVNILKKSDTIFIVAWKG
jgi:SAM-dependent methyltransferase